MANNYYGNRGNGSSLRHYRTKGSRNGYSKDPNYRPVGSKAVGKIVNGRYVYYTNTSDAGGNNWQQRGNLHRAINEVGQRAATGTTSAYNGFGTTKQSTIAANDAGKRYTGGFGYDQSLNRAAARVAAGKRVTTPQRTQVASAKSKRDKAVAKGAANNWQQQAAAEANSHMQRNRLIEGKARSYAIAPKSLNGKVITVENNNRDEHKKQMANSERLMKKTTDAMKSNYPSRYPADENGYNEYDRPQYTVAGTKRMETAKRNSMLNEISRMNTRRERQALEDRLAAGAKAREKRQKKREREAKINKMKNAILSVFKKKK